MHIVARAPTARNTVGLPFNCVDKTKLSQAELKLVFNAFLVGFYTRRAFPRNLCDKPAVLTFGKEAIF